MIALKKEKSIRVRSEAYFDLANNEVYITEQLLVQKLAIVIMQGAFWVAGKLSRERDTSM